MSRTDCPNKSEAHTLRYFRRGWEKSDLGYWLPEENTPPERLLKLLSHGLIQRGLPPNADCFRITEAGLDALDGAV